MKRFNESRVTRLRSATARQAWACPNYRDRAKILLAMPLDPAKSGDHEVCSSDHSRFHCVRFASIRGFTTAFPCESGAAI
jgi:hypothetical protein